MASTYQHTALAEADTGKVIRSPGWYRMLDYPVGVFQPDMFTWENIIHADDDEAVMGCFEAFFEGRTCIAV